MKIFTPSEVTSLNFLRRLRSNNRDYVEHIVTTTGYVVKNSDGTYSLTSRAINDLKRLVYSYISRTLNYGHNITSQTIDKLTLSNYDKLFTNLSRLEGFSLNVHTSNMEETLIN